MEQTKSRLQSIRVIMIPYKQSDVRTALNEFAHRRSVSLQTVCVCGDVCGVDGGCTVWMKQRMINVERLVIENVAIESDRYGCRICRMVGFAGKQGWMRPYGMLCMVTERPIVPR